ncbi:hypothetical protein BGZ59_006403 [Podila verticillata]|nr:hypothetical protein BGZ59_006403 [Podila verticillata]
MDVKTSYQHFELYRDSLETIKNRKIVATKLKTLAEKLLERLSYDEFITTFTGLLGKHEENRPSPRYADSTLAWQARDSIQSGSKGNQGRLVIAGDAVSAVVYINLNLNTV